MLKFVKIFFACCVLLPTFSIAEVTESGNSTLTTQTFLDSRLIEETLFPSTSFIEIETAKLNKKPYRLSQDEISKLRQELNAKYNPEEIKKALSIHLQQEPDNIQQGFVELNKVLSSEFASQLSSARQEAAQANKNGQVGDYQESLDLKKVKEHRFQIARTYDGLQKLSTSQSIIFQQIQGEIRSSLNEGQSSTYKTKDPAERLEELKQLNQSLSLYAFRQIPAKDFIPYFNALATPSVQAALEAYEKDLRTTLEELEKNNAKEALLQEDTLLQEESLLTGGSLLGGDSLLLDDGLMLNSSDMFGSSDAQEKSWKDYFVFSLAHQETHDDEGENPIFRNTVRVEYEQAFANNWFARLDVKGTHYQLDDRQALQKGENYNRGKVKAAWLQYSQGACAIKAGQQSLIWGQVDGTFAVDDITPFDFTEKLLTDYSAVRLPQVMVVNDCFFANKKQTQLFYIPKAQLHLSSHLDDEYSLMAASGIDDEDLDSEWGARFKFSFGKTDFALMYADLISNGPTYVLPDLVNPPIPALSEYKLYGFSINHTSGSWQFKSDIGYKTDQLLQGTLSEMSDVVDAAIGVQYLSRSNHNFNLGIWGQYTLDDEQAPTANDSTPFITFNWSKQYLGDSLDLSLLASGRENPKTSSATAQASYKVNDYWNVLGAVTLVDNDDTVINPLQSNNNEFSFEIKYQF